GRREVMGEPAATTRRDLEARLVARAWADEGFRERLKADPRAAVAEETGVSVPESIEIEVLEETPEKAYLVIPLNRVEISEEDLGVAGGGEYGTCEGSCGCGTAAG
ncbi:MAG: NHLP leader peptide family RiPP precursor, partial [Gaiellaceae bacterium]